GAGGLAFIALQWRQAATIEGMNRELEANNEFLASVSTKISRYLSPQIYKSIFTGQTDVTIHTERKKLTIFFSDIKDFTATTERTQPEEIALLLNEYLTETSADAPAHGVADETSALVRDIVPAYPLPAISMKGISREVVPYAIESTLDASGRQTRTFSEHLRGLDFYLDPSALDPAAAAHVRKLLCSAMASLEDRIPK